MADSENGKELIVDQQIEEEVSEEESEDWDFWREEVDDDNDEEENCWESDFLCLFCDSKHGSCDSLFEHCRLSHHFDFYGIKKELNLDFYSSFKLINYVRSQVANNKCWSCGFICQSKEQLQRHLHEAADSEATTLQWEDEKYLKPFMEDDSLLYSFFHEEKDEDNQTTAIDKELVRDVQEIEAICIASDDNADEHTGEKLDLNGKSLDEKVIKDVASTSSGTESLHNPAGPSIANGVKLKDYSGTRESKIKSKQLGVCAAGGVAKDIEKVNKNYFGSYSSFGIHKEMISDKVRTEAYRQAILQNPSLLNGAVVMDVGCGTGILSLFAAQAGASRVIAVEASEKMAAVATQIAKDNGLSRSNKDDGIIEVVRTMVEDLDKHVWMEPHSIDVLISEWMGYCLLYESMLSSVIYARDRWLKPGGAVLPDTATIFVAGFGKGGTSLPFWENVYGFNMSCIGKEIVQDAARIPIVDLVDDKDLVTEAAVLQTFDLATMRPEEVDFTATVELEPKSGSSTCNPGESEQKSLWCYGIVLWFDTGFSSKFCKEKPVNLSTSPYTPGTHWAQTIFAFQEPIAIGPAIPDSDKKGAFGTDSCPASRIHLRVSIVRASEHRSIDISLETTGIGSAGQKRSWPAQIFNLS